MGNSVLRNTVYAAVKEDTENTYKAPATDIDYVQVIPDGAELTPSKELLSRNVLSGSIGQSTPRTGIKSVTGALPVEFRSGETEGEVPEYSDLMEAALGNVRNVTTTTIDDADSGGPHTTSRMYLLDADASKYNVGDIVTVKVAGDYHTSPISAVSNTPGDVYVDLLIPAANPFTDGDVIAAVSTYVTADSGHPSLSISKWIEGARLEQATGVRVNSVALENFTTGQIASWNFGFEGLNFDQSLSAQPHTPNYDDTLPPIILNACIFQDGVQIDINEFGLTLENTLGFVTSTCSPNGRLSSRLTARSVSGTFNPYKQDDDVSQFDNFNQNIEFSLFGFAYNPSGVDGEYGNVVAFYIPKCIITEVGEADQDGVLQETLTFQATRGADALTEELYVSFS